MDSLTRAFGLVVRELRREHGVSQEELAKRAGVTRITVSRIERGLNSPSLTTTLSFAEAFGMPSAALILRTQEMHDRLE